MRRWIVALLFAITALAPASAYDATEAAALDRLFRALAVADTPDAARAIDRQIWAIWMSPADPVLAERMREVQMARMESPIEHVRDLLDDIVIDFPDYAEGWNQRATVAFMTGDYEASLADIDEVLKREPRHFGALSGQAMIYDIQGRRSLAVDVMRRALDVHPFLVEKARFPELDVNRTRA